MVRLDERPVEPSAQIHQLNGLAFGLASQTIRREPLVEKERLLARVVSTDTE